MVSMERQFLRSSVGRVEYDSALDFPGPIPPKLSQDVRNYQLTEFRSGYYADYDPLPVRYHRSLANAAANAANEENFEETTRAKYNYRLYTNFVLSFNPERKAAQMAEGLIKLQRIRGGRPIPLNWAPLDQESKNPPLHPLVQFQILTTRLVLLLDEELEELE